MTQERIARVDSSAAGTHTHTTVITDGPNRGGGSALLIILVLVVLGLFAFVLLGPMAGAKVAKDNAVADAAGSVGEAAESVGAAADGAADAITN